MLLEPAYDTTADTRALLGKKAKQAYYYNRHARDLLPIPVGETVRIKLPGEKHWTPGTCTGVQGPRSYGVRVGETEYRRNRRQLLRMNEAPIPEVLVPEAPMQREMITLPAEGPIGEAPRTDGEKRPQHVTLPSIPQSPTPEPETPPAQQRTIPSSFHETAQTAGLDYIVRMTLTVNLD